MTVSAQTPLNRSTGNGVTTVFPYTFKILAQGDIKVTVAGVVQTLTTNYTVSGVGVEGGGNVTMLIPPANGATVVRRRTMALIRTVDFQDQGELPTNTLDDDQDAPILMIQQLNEELGRALTVPPEASGVNLQLPTPTALTYLRWNALANAIENVLLTNVSLITLTTYAQTLLNAADAAVARGVLGAAASGAINNSGLTSMAYGQCLLTKSGANLLLSPLRGNLLTVNGVTCTVPDAGVTLAPTGLLVSTLYYIYAVATAGVITSLEASTTGHSVDTTAGNKGVEIKTGDATRSLVGLAYCKTAATFLDTAADRLVRSWFNRPSVALFSAFTASRSTSSGSFVELNSEIRCNWVQWVDDVPVAANTGTANNNSGSSTYSVLGWDGVADANTNTASNSATGLFNNIAQTASKAGLTEGFHYVTLMGATSGGTVGNWTGGVSFNSISVRL